MYILNFRFKMYILHFCDSEYSAIYIDWVMHNDFTLNKLQF